MREKAKEYADKMCGENDEYLKIYHAYEDGHSDGRDIQPNGEFLMGILIGVIAVLIILVLLQTLGLKIFAE